MDSNVLITGASTGIGKQLAYEFGPNVNSLILCSRSEKKLLQLKKRIENENLKVHVFPCDLSIQQDCELLSKYSWISDSDV